MSRFNESEARSLLAEYGRKLVSSGLVQGSWGNLSIRIDDDYMICTPSGLDYTRLGPSDMVKVNIKTLEYDAVHEHKPTSEKLFHSRIYLTRPDAGAIVHVHSLYSCIFAACEKNLHIQSPDNAARIGNVVLCADYGMAGTATITRNIVKALRKSDSKGCFMNHHGMVCYGEDLQSAFENALIIEKEAESFIMSDYKE